jgi:hypothetical protein
MGRLARGWERVGEEEGTEVLTIVSKRRLLGLFAAFALVVGQAAVAPAAALADGNLAPVITAPATIHLAEDTTLASPLLLGSFTDDGPIPWTVRLAGQRIGNDVRTVTSTGVITAPGYYPDWGNNTIAVTVSDAAGLSTTVNVAIVVDNDPPTVGPITLDGDLVGGKPAVGKMTIATASFTDPSQGWYLTPETFTCTIDWGDGAGPQPGTIGSYGCGGFTHYADAGAHQITVEVMDSRGASGSGGLATTVVGLYAPPAVEVSMSNYNPVEEAVVASATFTDPDSDGETYTCSVDYGDGTVVDGVVSGMTCVGPEHHYARTGSYAPVVTVTDSHGLSGSATSGVSYLNRAPWVGGGLVGAFIVGSPVHDVAAIVDPGSESGFETYTCTVDYGDGSPLETGTYVPTWPDDGIPRCVGPDHVYAAAGSYSIVTTVTDSGGETGSSIVIETIAAGFNAAPVITGISFDPEPSLQALPVAAVATFTDNDLGNVPPETYSCVVAYGDSTGGQPGTIVDHECRGPAHVYTGFGPFTVEVFVFDSNGASSWDSTTYSPLNVSPVVSAYGLVSFGQSGADYGSSVIFTDPGAGPGQPAETYTCTIDYGDGSGTRAGVISGSICTDQHHAYASKGTYTYLATVTDSNGATGTFSIPVVIYNPAPSTGPVSAPGSVTVGASVTASAPYVSTGRETPDTCTVDYGDGAGPAEAVADGFTCTGPSHSYSTAGTFTIVVKVTSDMGSSSSSSASITVKGLEPSVGAVMISGSAVEGSAVTASAGFTSAGGPATGCTVNYGDGTGVKTGTISGTTCKGPKHVYGTAGNFTITITVTSSNGTGTSISSVTIANVLPSFTKLTLPKTARAGSTVLASATFTDPGSTEVYTVQWYWGDGTTSSGTLAAGVRTASATHKYSTAGTYNVTIFLFDSMGSVDYTWSAIAVYDPGRKLTGSGTLASWAGACHLPGKCSTAGTGTFNVSASYGAASTPTVTFTFSAPGLTFTATSAAWFVAVPGDAAIQGTGKMNGLSGYCFWVHAVDARPDGIGITILDPKGNVVYDNGVTPLKTGSIAIK